jgi:hypothetical protein
MNEATNDAVSGMNRQTKEHLSLSEAMPIFATELRELLDGQGEAELAAQVANLMILDRCRCGDDFCATFYTQPKPNGGFGLGHRNVRLMPEEGMLILDVVGKEIACVEILDRPDIRDKLDAVIPTPNIVSSDQGRPC